jgi:hypothetical protein
VAVRWLPESEGETQVQMQVGVVLRREVPEQNVGDSQSELQCVPF